MQSEPGNAGFAEQVERLAAALCAGRRLPGTRRMSVDRMMILDVIDQIRVAVPEQVQAARQVLQRRDQLLATARAEADAVLAEAHRQVHQQRLAGVVSDRAAAKRAARIEEQAWRTAE